MKNKHLTLFEVTREISAKRKVKNTCFGFKHHLKNIENKFKLNSNNRHNNSYGAMCNTQVLYSFKYLIRQKNSAISDQFLYQNVNFSSNDCLERDKGQMTLLCVQTTIKVFKGPLLPIPLVTTDSLICIIKLFLTFLSVFDKTHPS